MNTRIVLVAGFVSLLATAAGCARPQGPAAQSARPMIDYEIPVAAAAPRQLEPEARFESGVAVAPRLVDPARMDKPFASLSAR
jgi:hypothetical protein